MKIITHNISVFFIGLLTTYILTVSESSGQTSPQLAAGTDSSPTVMPEIWKKVSARDRLNLLRAAELDGTRQLLERVKGISIDGQTTVIDLAETDDKIKAVLSETITGVRTEGAPIYHDDGRVEVVRKIHLDQLVRRVEETYRRPEGGSLDSDSKTTVNKKEVIFKVSGLSAIRDSSGHKRVLAQRAAQVDAFRKLAERTGAVKVTSESTISNFTTTDDSIRNSVSKTIKNAESVSIKYLPDNSAEVTLRVNLNPIVRVIAKRVKDGETTLISDKTEQMVIEETGVGVAPEQGDVEVDVQIDSIIEQTLKQGGPNEL